MSYKIEWNLRTRVESWNLMTKACKKIGFYISPVVTTAYRMLSVFIDKCPRYDFDLFIMCIASIFDSIKTEISEINVDDVLITFSEAAGSLTNSQKEILGNSCNEYSGLKKDDRFKVESGKSKVLNAEMLLLTYNNWEFSNNHLFHPYLNWIAEIRGYVTQDKVENFRKARSFATHTLCLLIVSSENEFYPNDIMAAASISYSLDNYFQSLQMDPFDWTGKLKLSIDMDKTKELINLIPEIEAQIKEFSSINI